MPVFIDQTGREIILNSYPQKIISLVPSQTELLFYLGLNKEVIGITKFCIHPKEWFQTKTKVGGTKQLNIEKIKQLQPDLVIANKEENVKEQIEELEKYFPVWISDVNNLADARQMIYEVGKLIGKENEAFELNTQIENLFSDLQTSLAKIPACYLIWRNPYMTAGGDTFIHSMMELAGLENVFNEKTRYPQITIEELKRCNPQLILLSSEPYPFKEKHAAELTNAGINAQILLVDGEMFSWYGSRMLNAPSYFSLLKQKIHTIA